jgi:ribosomal protein S18 acetylase RimI-like enzyme
MSSPADAEPEPPCELLAWDSEHFGLSIARLRSDTLEAARASDADRWCTQRGVDCLYLLADSNHPETSRVAARHGYRVVDVRLNLRHELGGLGTEAWHSPGPLRVRPGSARDLGQLIPLAARSHRHSRFYFDGRFPEERCGALYARWIERAVNDPARELLVAEIDDSPVGYQALGLPEQGRGRLDLIALKPEYRGRGLGRAVLLAALRRLRGLGAEVVLTAMQARNADAVRAHERIGFALELTQIWHHKWYGAANGT